MNYLTELHELQRKAERLAFNSYLRTGHVPEELSQLIYESKQLALIVRANPHWQNQPRIPAGQPDGGQWTEDGTSAPHPDPELERLLQVDPPIQPVYPVEEALAFWLGGGAVSSAIRALEKARVAWRASRAASRVGLGQTIHGAQRFVQRGFSDADILEAVKTARQTGQVVTAIGRYGTPQFRYYGTNGVIVVVETEGRNAGKIITIMRQR
jgi:hypothetical protein